MTDLSSAGPVTQVALLLSLYAHSERHAALKPFIASSIVRTWPLTKRRVDSYLTAFSANEAPLAIHVDRVVVQIGLAGHGVEQVSLDASASG